MKKHLLFITGLMLLIASCKKDNSQKSEDKHIGETSSELVTLKSGIVVEKKGKDYYWQGDIKLSSVQFKALDEKGDIFPENGSLAPDKTIHPVYNLPFTIGSNNMVIPRALGIYPTPYNMWAMVRFTYNSNMPSYMINAVRQALYEIESSTNVRFYNATGQPTVDPTYGFAYPYVDFTYAGNSSTSDSQLGRVGGRQAINLGDFASSQPGVIIHEICHALGMLHEQCRPDRDNFVNVNTSNLTPQGQANFQKRTSNYYYIGNYDFNSVMGYSSYTGSTTIVYNSNLPMYTKKDGTNISQGTQLSSLDRQWLNSTNLPYIARSDVYRELATTVYKPDNTVITEEERLDLQAQLNYGNPNPPSCCRIPNNF